MGTTTQYGDHRDVPGATAKEYHEAREIVSMWRLPHEEAEIHAAACELLRTPPDPEMAWPDEKIITVHITEGPGAGMSIPMTFGQYKKMKAENDRRADVKRMHQQARNKRLTRKRRY